MAISTFREAPLWRVTGGAKGGVDGHCAQGRQRRLSSSVRLRPASDDGFIGLRSGRRRGSSGPGGPGGGSFVAEALVFCSRFCGCYEVGMNLLPLSLIAGVEGSQFFCCSSFFPSFCFFRTIIKPFVVMFVRLFLSCYGRNATGSCCCNIFLIAHEKKIYIFSAVYFLHV